MRQQTCDTCGTTAIPRIVLADDGDACIIAWCSRCEDAAAGVVLEVEDIPGDLLARLLWIASNEEGRG